MIQVVKPTSQTIATEMQKVISSTKDFTESKNDIFYDDNNDSDTDSKRSLNNDDKYNDNSGSNRDDDDEIEKNVTELSIIKN